MVVDGNNLCVERLGLGQFFLKQSLGLSPDPCRILVFELEKRGQEISAELLRCFSRKKCREMIYGYKLECGAFWTTWSVAYHVSRNYPPESEYLPNIHGNGRPIECGVDRINRNGVIWVGRVAADVYNNGETTGLACLLYLGDR